MHFEHTSNSLVTGMADPPLGVTSSLGTVIAENRTVIIAPYINQRLENTL